MKKFITLVLLVLLALSLSAGTFFADDAGLVSPEERESVENYLSLFGEYMGIPVYVHTAEDYGEYGTVEEAVDAYMYENYNELDDIFSFHYYDSAAEYYIATWGEASDVVEDWGLSYILDFVSPDIDSDNYADAFIGAGYAATEVYDVYYGIDMGLVTDNASLLTKDEVKEVEKALLEARNTVGFPVLVLTDTSNHGKSDMAYADDYQESVGYPDGILLFLNMGERSFWETTMGVAIEAYSDRSLQRLEDRFLKYLSSGDYAGAFIAFADGAVDLAWSDYSSSSSYYVGDTDMDYEDEGLAGGFGTLFAISLIVGLISGAIGLGAMKRQMRGAAMVDDASDYARLDTFSVSERKDVFLYSNVTRVKIESSSSSGGGGHTTHHSSSGVSHGGHGGRF